MSKDFLTAMLVFGGFLLLFGLAGSSDFRFHKSMESQWRMRVAHEACMSRKEKMRIEYWTAEKSCRELIEDHEEMVLSFEKETDIINYMWGVVK